jgi:signal transduction histidine kinase/CHASE3 domain sensor protein
MMISRLNKLRIGPRLILCFAVIILLMLVGNSLLVWQFRLVHQQSDRVTSLAQELVVVSRFQTDVLSLDAKLDSLAKSEDIAGLKREAGHLRSVLVSHTEAVRDALVHLPSDVPRDSAVLPTVEAVETTLPPQLDAVIALGAASDWNAVRLRLANEKKPLEASASDLVRNVQQQVSNELAQSVAQAKRVRSRILLILPLTAFLTLLMATLLGTAITHSITAPLRQLLQGSTALAQGDFDYQLQLSGNDEFTHVGTVFNETIAKLRELYRELQSSETYLAEAQRLSHTGSYGWQVSTGEIYWSDETFRIFEIDPANKPSSEAILQRTHPQDKRFLQQVIHSAAREGRELDFEHRLMMPNGSVKYLRVLGHPSNDESGNLEFRGVIMDMTERKRSEEERERLRQLEAGLAHIDRVSMMGEMAASLAHEIKQPIAAAITSANTCIEWLAHEPPNLDRARAAARRVARDGTRAAEIIDGLRSLYKKSPPQRELVDVNGLIQEMLTLLRGEATRYSLAMRTELAADLPKIMADRVQLQQVFMNLMLNGIEAMEDSGGELTIKSQLQDGQLLFSVSDTGVGLPTEKMDHLFSAFFTTKPQGSGMGLAITRSIVESHGGRLWATTNCGEGATFHFTLPTKVTDSSTLVA